MFADVVLQRRVPPRFESVTYNVPDGMKPQVGQVIKVPFGKNVIPAMVTRLHTNKPSYATKSISELGDFIVSEKCLKLALWMSEEYKTPLCKIIQYFIPEHRWSGKKKTASTFKDDQDKHLAIVTASVHALTLKILEKPGVKILLEKSLLPRHEFYALLSKRIFWNDPEAQVLFLHPEIFSLETFSQPYLRYHGDMSENEQAEAWEAINEGRPGAVAATRAGLFLPFKKLSCIVLDLEYSDSYKELRAPYYHATEVAEKLAELWNIPLVIIGTVPRTETWYKTISKKYETLLWDPPYSLPTITTVDINDERRKGNKEIFSPHVSEKIVRALTKNEQVLIFINRKGEAGALICTECSSVVRCEKCQNPLTLHKNATLKCHRDGTTIPTPSSCNECGSVTLRPLGFGTEKIEKEIKGIFEKAKVLRVDKDTMGKDFDEKALKDADIIIATRIIDKPLTLPRLSLVIALLPENLLSFPDFRASEKALQLLTHLTHLTSGEFILQTFMPNHSLFEHLKNRTIEEFYKEELALRQIVNLPPFC